MMLFRRVYPVSRFVAVIVVFAIVNKEPGPGSTINLEVFPPYLRHDRGLTISLASIDTGQPYCISNVNIHLDHLFYSINTNQRSPPH